MTNKTVNQLSRKRQLNNYQFKMLNSLNNKGKIVLIPREGRHLGLTHLYLTGVQGHAQAGFVSTTNCGVAVDQTSNSVSRALRSNKESLSYESKTGKNIIIFIDESGTLPDPKDPVIVIAAVGTKLPEKLTEIKFYRTGEKTKKKFLKELVGQKISLFVLVIEKHGQKIPDTPENFALLCWLLLEDCLLFYQKDIKKLIFDRHFHKTKDQETFDQKLIHLLKQTISIKHLDSQQNPEINTADMVAGSLLWKHTGKSTDFYQIIKDLIVSERVLNWKKAKRKFWQGKISSNRRKRPSRRE